MWQGAVLRFVLVLAASVIALMAQVSCAGSESNQYRGQYTYGHEVHSFCPDDADQCYWISAETLDAGIIAIKQTHQENTSKPYESICILISGEVDVESERRGFAADYDGILRVTGYYGLCE